MALSVSSNILKSFLFAPATIQESGMPFRSVMRDRFVPIFALSVGFFPIFFPTQRCLGHRSIRTAETPIDTFYCIIPLQAVFPYPLECPILSPFLKSSMRRTWCAYPRFIERIPLTPGFQYKKYPIHRATIWNPRPMTSKGMPCFMLGDERLYFIPYLVRNYIMLSYYLFVFHMLSVYQIFPYRDRLLFYWASCIKLFSLLSSEPIFIRIIWELKDSLFIRRSIVKISEPEQPRMPPRHKKHQIRKKKFYWGILPYRMDGGIPNALLIDSAGHP